MGEGVIDHNGHQGHWTTRSRLLVHSFSGPHQPYRSTSTWAFLLFCFSPPPPGFVVNLIWWGVGICSRIILSPNWTVLFVQTLLLLRWPSCCGSLTGWYILASRRHFVTSTRFWRRQLWTPFPFFLAREFRCRSTAPVAFIRLFTPPFLVLALLRDINDEACTRSNSVSSSSSSLFLSFPQFPLCRLYARRRFFVVVF